MAQEVQVFIPVANNFAAGDLISETRTDTEIQSPPKVSKECNAYKFTTNWIFFLQTVKSVQRLGFR